MNGTGPQLAPLPVSPPEQPGNPALPKGRSPLAHLLHALNQPLTGLQCSLELAVAGPRRAEQYRRTLREGLELTLRMRILVDAIRELSDSDNGNDREKDNDNDQQEPVPGSEAFRFDVLLRETADDLRPVAESRNVRLECAMEAPLPLRADRGRMAVLLFRLLESALSLTRAGGELRIQSRREGEWAVLVVAWSEAAPPEHSPFSRPELGLLIARRGIEHAGGEWTSTRADSSQICTIRLPLVSEPRFSAPDADPGRLR